MRVRTGAGSPSMNPLDWPTMPFRDRCRRGRSRGAAGGECPLRWRRQAAAAGGRRGGGWGRPAALADNCGTGAATQGCCPLACSAWTSWVLPLAISWRRTSAGARACVVWGGPSPVAAGGSSGAARCAVASATGYTLQCRCPRQQRLAVCTRTRGDVKVLVGGALLGSHYDRWQGVPGKRGGRDKVAHR